MNDPLRYVLVGTGGFGRSWCEQFLPHLTIKNKARAVAAVDLKPENLLNAQKHLGVPADKCYADVNRALDENPADFVIVVVPPAFHEKIVDAALAHGCHILSEKPIADTMAGCVRIRQKVKAAGKKMAVTMSHRFDQDKQTLEAQIKGGAYGRLNYVVHRFTCNKRKLSSWGVFRHQIPDPLLVEGTVHHFDMHRALSGADGKTVFARTWNPPWGEFAGDSTALINIEMTNGVNVFYEGAKANATDLNNWSNDYLRAECEQGTLELDRRKLQVLSDLTGQRTAIPIPLQEREFWRNGWLAEMYCDWLAGRRDSHPTNIDDNIQCAALLFAAIESAHTGQPVDVQAFLRKALTA